MQSTQRAGGGDHSDHVFKRFDKNGEETPFENAGSKGEYVKGNMQPSLRSRKAVETYLERVAKAAGRKGAKEGEKAKARLERDAGAGDKDKKDAAENPCRRTRRPSRPRRPRRGQSRARGAAGPGTPRASRAARADARPRRQGSRGESGDENLRRETGGAAGKRDGKRGRRSGDGDSRTPPTSLPSAETLLRADADAIETAGLSKDKEARFVKARNARTENDERPRRRRRRRAADATTRRRAAPSPRRRRRRWSAAPRTCWRR